MLNALQFVIFTIMMIEHLQICHSGIVRKAQSLLSAIDKSTLTDVMCNYFSTEIESVPLITVTAFPLTRRLSPSKVTLQYKRCTMWHGEYKDDNICDGMHDKSDD